MAERQLYVRLSVKDADRALKELKRVGIQGEQHLGRLPPAAKRASRGMLALDKAGRSLRGGMISLAGHLGPIEGIMEELGPAGLVGAAGLGAIAVALRSAIRRAVQAADAFKQLQDTADLVGFGVERLQELRFAGEQVGVSVQTTDMALQRFSRRIGEVAQGTGELQKVAEQYGVRLRDNRGRMRANIDILRDFADIIRNAESEQEALRIGFKLFDSEGARFALTLRNGRKGLAAYAREARRLGIVVDEALVREGAKASNELRTVQRVIDTQLNVALVRLAPAITDVLRAFAEAARLAGRFAEALRDVEQQSEGFVRRRIGAINEELAALLEAQREGRFFEFGEVTIGGPEEVEQRIAELRALRERLQAELARRETDRPADPRGAGGPAPGGGGEESEAEKARRRIEERIAALEREARVAGAAAGESELLRERLRLEAIAREAGIGLTDRQVERLERAIAAKREAAEADDHLAQLQTRVAERMDAAAQVIDDTASTQEKLTARRRELMELLPELTVQLGSEAAARERINRALEETREKLEGTEDRLRLNVESAIDFGDALRSSLRGAIVDFQALDEVAERFLDRLANQAFDVVADQLFGPRSATLSSGEGGGGVLGDVLSVLPGFAHGGRPPVGRAAVVGERGPEVRVFDRPGTVLSHASLERAADAMVRVATAMQAGGPPAGQAGGDDRPIVVQVGAEVLDRRASARQLRAERLA